MLANPDAPKSGWHAPIVMVEGKVISAAAALKFGVLTQAVITAHRACYEILGNHDFGKQTCPHCVRAKGYLDQAGVIYAYHDVVGEPAALHQMPAWVKPIVGPKTPITVPQIWIDGRYVGGAAALVEITAAQVETDPNRGRCSVSPGRLDAAPSAA